MKVKDIVDKLYHKLISLKCLVSTGDSFVSGFDEEDSSDTSILYDDLFVELFYGNSQELLSDSFLELEVVYIDVCENDLNRPAYISIAVNIKESKSQEIKNLVFDAITDNIKTKSNSKEESIDELDKKRFLSVNTDIEVCETLSYSEFLMRVRNLIVWYNLYTSGDFVHDFIFIYEGCFIILCFLVIGMKCGFITEVELHKLQGLILKCKSFHV